MFNPFYVLMYTISYKLDKIVILILMLIKNQLWIILSIYDWIISLSLKKKIAAVPHFNYFS